MVKFVILRRLKRNVNQLYMNYLKRFTTVFLLSTFAFCLHAELVVLSRTGLASTFVPSEVKRITFDGGKMYVVTRQGETHEWLISEVQKCYFGALSEDPTSIETLQNRKLRLSQHVLYVDVTAKAVLKVVNAEGRVVLAKKVSAGKTSVSLDALPSGVYVVTIGGETLKLLKR